MIKLAIYERAMRHGCCDVGGALCTGETVTFKCFRYGFRRNLIVKYEMCALVFFFPLYTAAFAEYSVSRFKISVNLCDSTSYNGAVFAVPKYTAA